MNVATILKQKGSGVFTATSDKSLLDIAKPPSSSIVLAASSS